jgi:SAM-dependent methyltransferase
LACTGCAAQYPLLHGIPDLRVEQDCWIDFDEDRRRALEAGERVARDGLDAAIHHVFRSSRGFDEKRSDYRTRQVLDGVAKCLAQCGDWLKPPMSERGLVLDLGCGPGQMLAAAAQLGRDAVGIDASMEWLVIAKHLAARFGGAPQLAAGLAEQLPIQDGVISAVISLDVIEHVGDQNAYVQEIRRVLAPGGVFALSTPNRYSLSPEPHVNVWGVGYLPRRFQEPYVQWAAGRSYAFNRLLSVWEAKGFFSRERGFDAEIVFPVIAAHEIANFSDARRKLARIYNRLVEMPALKPLFPLFGAYYRIVGRTLVDRPVRA